MLQSIGEKIKFNVLKLGLDIVGEIEFEEFNSIH